MKLDRIYTRGGDKGETSLGDGARVPKHQVRVRAVGGLDEANAVIGVALLHIDDSEVRDVLIIAQNDLFDLGADLCKPEREDAKKTPLRVTGRQVETLEREIDRFNEGLSPLTSFVLPGGSAGAPLFLLAPAHLLPPRRRIRVPTRRPPRHPAGGRGVERACQLPPG